MRNLSNFQLRGRVLRPVYKSFLAAICLLGLWPVQVAYAETQVVDGYWSITNCPGVITPCWIQYGASIPVTPGISPSPSVGITPCLAGSSAGVCILKASAGNLYGVYITAGATNLWLQVFNSATEPVDGATTTGTAAGNMQECIVVPAGQSVSLSYGNGPPEVFTTGIVVVASSTSCATKTKSTTAFINGRAA